MSTLPRPEVIEYAGFVLAHCAVVADDHREGELICPFSVLADSHGHRVVDFESATQEEAVEKGWSSLDASRRKGEWWAFGREGLYRTGESAVDVLLVSVWAPGMDKPATLSQSFARTDDGALYLLGDPVLFLGGREGAESVSEWDTEALIRGIQSHPKGDRWATWSQQ